MQNVNVQGQNNQPAQNQSGPSSNQNALKFIVGVVVILVGVGGYFGYQQFLAKSQSEQGKQPAISQDKTDKNTNDETGLAQIDKEAAGSDTAPAGSEGSLPPIKDDQSQQVSSEASLTVTSSKSNYSVGDKFTGQVNLSSPTVPEGVEFVLSYDPQILTNVSLEKGQSFSTYLKTNVYQDKGKIKVVIIKNPGEEINLQGQTNLVSISGDVKQAGRLSLSFDEEQTIVAATGGKDILQSTKDLTVQVQ